MLWKNKFELKVRIINRELGRINHLINQPAKPGDCGYDVFATCNKTLLPHERFNMPLGIALEFTEGHFCQVNQKSGLANKFGIDTIGNVIDSAYRGEIHAQIVNTSNDVLKIDVGQKIAQLIFIPFVKANIEYVDELSKTERGTDGFGSTGK